MGGRFLLAVLLTGLTTCAAQLTADFHMAGVTGSAQFSWSANTNNLSVTVQLSGQSLGSGQPTVEIRPIWVKYDVSDKCSSSLLGTAPSPMSTSLVNNLAVFQGVTSLDSIEGQSIVLNGSSITVCGTIKKQADPYKTAVAFFKDKVFGTVYFRQNNAITSSTRLVSDLFTADNAFSSGMWKVSASGTDCSSVDANADVYNPSASDGTGCGITSHQSCAVGNLSGKLGNVTVGTDQRKARTGYTDTNLPLRGNSSIVDKLLLIYPSSGSGSPACAVIREYTGRTAISSFNHDGVKGSIIFSQLSPLDPTTTTVSLEGLRKEAGGYHVHLWPTPTKTVVDQELCSATVVSGHFNPYGKNPSDPMYPSPANSTNDMYELGDLSSKYGTLEGQDKFDGTYTDWNLPLFGSNSIIGRSLVIHHNDASKSRWVCANIELEDSNATVVAIAAFKYPVIGHILFMQEKDKPYAETSVFAHLDYNDGRTETQSNKWMVNSNQIQNDMLFEDEMMRCKSTGSVYNPQNLWLDLAQSNNLYVRYCSDNPPFACKVGDLSGRLGPLHIRNSAAQGDTASRQFFTDMNLPLSGPLSVIGKSLVIMNAENTAIVSCTHIQMLHNPKLYAEFSMGGLSGKVSFSQTAGLGAVKTEVMNSLSGFADNHRLRIHELPPMDGNSPCTDLGNIYNPLNITQDLSSGYTDDKYKVGDLTRHRTEVSWSSYNLPLTGRISIMGRSLVVVDSNNKVLACAKIQPYLPDSSSQHVMATSTFTGDISGTIHLFQALYSDGTMSDTSILINLQNKNGSQTPNHNWHTHVSPVQGDNQAAKDRCMSAGPHFDPYRAMANKDNYVECKPANPFRCEVGDQAQKLEPYSLGGGRKVFTDVDLPIAGPYSVQGRSMVVHVRDRGAARQDCADIIPVTSDAIEVEFSTPDTLDKRSVAETYAGAIRANPEDVVVELISATNGITKVHVHFLGLQREDMRSRFVAVLKDENKRGSLGAYAPYVSAGCIQVMSTVLFMLVLTMHLITHL